MDDLDHILVKPSLFDRLLDENFNQPTDPVQDRAQSIRQLKRSVLRDLENLFNSRNALAGLDADFTEVRRSVASYGLPDFSQYNIRNPRELLRLTRTIESCVRDFEPRLSEVEVQAVPLKKGSHRTLRFEIDAKLRVDPIDEPVRFDMELQLNRQECRMLSTV